MAVERRRSLSRRLPELGLLAVLLLGLLLTGTRPTRAAASLKAQYRAGDTNATDNQVKPHLSLVNTGTTAVTLSTIKLRYYYTKEGTAGEQYFCDYAVKGCGNITGTLSSGYLELGFASGAGSLSAGQSSGEIQSRVAKTDWSSYNEADDYSFDPTKTAFADWSRVTIYENGALIWGTPPGTTPATATGAPSTATRTFTGAPSTATRTFTGAPSTATPVPGNLLLNGGFETDANGDGDPDSWTSHANVTRSSAARRSGTYAIRHQSTANNGYVIAQTVNGIAAGASYGFSGWTMIPATGDAFTYRVELLWRNGTSTIRTDVVRSFTATTNGSWVQASGSYTAPANTTNLVVRMNVSSLNATIYSDDFALSRAGAATATSTQPPATATHDHPSATRAPSSTTGPGLPTPTQGSGGITAGTTIAQLCPNFKQLYIDRDLLDYLPSDGSGGHGDHAGQQGMTDAEKAALYGYNAAAVQAKAGDGSLTLGELGSRALPEVLHLVGHGFPRDATCKLLPRLALLGPDTEAPTYQKNAANPWPETSGPKAASAPAEFVQALWPTDARTYQSAEKAERDRCHDQPQHEGNVGWTFNSVVGPAVLNDASNPVLAAIRTRTHPISGAPLGPSFSANAPMEVTARLHQENEGFWYQVLLFKNTNHVPYYLDCAVLWWVGPSSMSYDLRNGHYNNSQRPGVGYGHPQRDIIEVVYDTQRKLSVYVVRIAFHDEPYNMRTAYPNQYWSLEVGTPAKLDGLARYTTAAERQAVLDMMVSTLHVELEQGSFHRNDELLTRLKLRNRVSN